MIAFFNVLMDVVYLTVVVLALRLGGRYERYMGFVHMAIWIAFHVAQRLSSTKLPLATYATIDLALISAHLWLLWRVRAAWLVWSLGAVALTLALEAVQMLGLSPSVWVYFHGAAVLNYVQLGSLAYAVLRRRIGPPFPVAAPTGAA